MVVGIDVCVNASGHIVCVYALILCLFFQLFYSTLSFAVRWHKFSDIKNIFLMQGLLGNCLNLKASIFEI